jgi:diphthine-ammonia ligase
MELWLPNNKLISKEAWEEAIETIHNQVSSSQSSTATNQQLIKETFTEAVKNRLPTNNFGILFSGGVDSSFIALTIKNLGSKFTCYTVGFHDQAIQPPQDIIAAEKAAKQFNFDLKTRIFTLDEIESLVHQAIKILKPTKLHDAVSISVTTVILAATQLAYKDNINEFFGGLGAEEIFAGYHRHKKAEDVQAECWSGLKAMWSKDLIRDATIAAELKIKVHTPFLDEQLIKSAMSIPPEQKINQTDKKIILRQVAEQAGLPKEIAWRKKQAAQYGSGFDKAIEKLARKHGFKTKGEYLGSLYITCTSTTSPSATT